MKPRIRQRWLQGLAIAAGVALALIGVRFALVPRSAARFFGIDMPASPAHLHYVIALRDIWLGLLLIVFALLRDWRSMALWLTFGAAVCFTDAVVVANATAWTGPLLFHFMSGVYCASLAIMCWGEARRAALPPTR